MKHMSVLTQEVFVEFDMIIMSTWHTVSTEQVFVAQHLTR